MTTPPPWSADSTTVAYVINLAVFSFLALLAVIGRLWARRIQRHALDISDYFIIMSLAWALASSIKTIYSNVYWALGADASQAGNPNAIQSLVEAQGKAFVVGIILWAVSVFFIRASILVLYIRIFRTNSFRMVCYILHGVNAAFFVTTILAPCLICRPIAFNWNRNIPGGICGDQKKLDLFVGIFNLLLDIAMVILPMPVLWGLQMATNKKVMLSFMFGLGTVICIITAVRVRITVENHGSNSTKVYSLIALLSCLEELLGICNACLPVMKPLYTKFCESKAKKWLYSSKFGYLPFVMRLSQMGSSARSRNSHHASAEHNSATKPAPSKGTRKWHGNSNNNNNKTKDLNRGYPPTERDAPPPPRYIDEKPTRLIFSGTRSATSTPSSGSVTPRPPAPSKDASQHFSETAQPADDRADSAHGIYVQRSWHHDIETRASDEIDRRLLADTSSKRHYEDRW